MKNHEWVNVRLLQTNKRWSALKESQKQWICEMARVEYDKYVTEHGNTPRNAKKREFIEHVYRKIDEREIPAARRF